MGLPGKKLPKSAKGPRIARFKRTVESLTTCPKCKRPVRPHRACGFCGYYKGREVVAVKLKSKTSAKKTERAAAEKS